MPFNTDKQTLGDLNIFGRLGTGSVYSLFNRTVTVNGAALLEDFFRYPLSNADAINRRSAMIAYHVAANTVFPFTAELFDMAEQYLADTDERTKLSSQKQSLETRLQNLVATDAGYKIIFNGITALIKITRLFNDFMQAVIKPDESPYRHDTDVAELIQLLTKAPFIDLINEPAKTKLTREQMAVYDKALRFQHAGLVRKMLKFIYQLDVTMAVAGVAAERDFVLPSAFTDEQQVTTIDGFYHPMLKGAVPNTVEISRDGNVIFLTGANMAGKSTFMKSLGIAVYLAHMGFPVPAKSMVFKVLDGIYTTINLPDNLGIGVSHFYAEVLRIKKIANELSADKNIFVVFDELFRGTNVKDAYEATIAVTAAFAKKRNSIFVISTHIIEAGDVLKEQASNISFKYLPTIMVGNTPQYTYTLKSGVTADRHGMVIINNEGILEILKNGINKIPQS